MPSFRHTVPSRFRSAPAIVLALAGTILLGACNADSSPGGASREWMTSARVTGPNETCIPLAAISETRVRDGKTIDFLTSPRRGWRNVLPGPDACPGLSSEKAITYSTSLSQLCSTDIIHVLENWGGSPRRGAACGLGTFTPIELR